MDRKDFIKKGLLGTALFASAPAFGGLSKNEIDELSPLDVVGYNHLPNEEEEKDDHFVIHRANTRGTADHGWLKANFSFSFANYQNPNRMHFGILRVLNDDIIAPGRGFRMHPHDNMEIITIPLEGTLEHKDSMGNTSRISSGEVQVMSAGTGIRHSEFNARKDAEVKSFQIWLFPNKKSVTPRYDQIQLDPSQERKGWMQILSPSKNDQGVWIHQNAWFYLSRLSKGLSRPYEVRRSGNGVYAMIIEGKAKIQGHELGKRDAIGLWNTAKIDLKSLEDNTRILLMDLPMQLG